MPHDLPVSFPVAPDVAVQRRRAVFSSQATALSTHNIAMSSAQSTQMRRKDDEGDGLQLIDELTNRSLDPIFRDSLLVKQNRSPLSIWTTRAIVFIICIAVGFVGALFVQQLQSDPRKAVRQSWAADLAQQHETLTNLSAQVDELRSQVEQQSNLVSGQSTSKQEQRDQISSGTSPLKGEGITLTLANPVAAVSDGSTPRESGGQQLRVVTDIDLQQWVNILWQAGAEAISVNDLRLGVQTSIRSAGQSILVGVTSIQSPYVISAIGNKNVLADAVSEERQPKLYSAFEQAGIHPQVSKYNEIELKASITSDITYARRSEE